MISCKIDWICTEIGDWCFSLYFTETTSRSLLNVNNVMTDDSLYWVYRLRSGVMVLLDRSFSCFSICLCLFWINGCLLNRDLWLVAHLSPDWQNVLISSVYGFVVGLFRNWDIVDWLSSGFRKISWLCLKLSNGFGMKVENG